MLTVCSRFAAACPGIGYKGGVYRQAQPPRSKESLHTASILSKKKKLDEDEPKNVVDSGLNCKKMNLCPDQCKEDKEMDEIAEHVGGRCPKDPCSKVRDPCESYVKKHIGKKQNTSSKVTVPQKSSSKGTVPQNKSSKVDPSKKTTTPKTKPAA